MTIREEDIERACEWLVSNAEECAQARADRVALEEGRKHLKAIIMKEHTDLPLGAQEREAYADPRYKTHLDGLREAVYKDEKLRYLRSAAETKVEVFRTICANARGLR